MLSTFVSVTGRVQNVGSATSRGRGAPRGLTGWVQNMPDGSVEALAEGDGALERFEASLGRGPAGARVHNVDARWTATASTTVLHQGVITPWHSLARRCTGPSS